MSAVAPKMAEPLGSKPEGEGPSTIADGKNSAESDGLGSRWQTLLSSLGLGKGGDSGVPAENIGKIPDGELTSFFSDSLPAGASSSEGTGDHGSGSTPVEIATRGVKGELRNLRVLGRTDESAKKLAESRATPAHSGRRNVEKGGLRLSSANDAKVPGASQPDAESLSSAPGQVPIASADNVESSLCTDPPAKDRSAAEDALSISERWQPGAAFSDRQGGGEHLDSNRGVETPQMRAFEGGARGKESETEDAPTARGVDSAITGAGDRQIPACTEAGADFDLRAPRPVSTPGGSKTGRSSNEKERVGATASNAGVARSSTAQGDDNLVPDLGGSNSAQSEPRLPAGARQHSKKASAEHDSAAIGVAEAHFGNHPPAGVPNQTIGAESPAIAPTGNRANAHVAESVTAGTGASRDTFFALDGASSTALPIQIHGGTRHAEAGFQDPALGWIGVRAEMSGGGIHAALLPGSTSSAQVLSAELPGLHSFLAEHRSPVQSLTMASPDVVADQTGNQQMQSGSGGGGQEQGSGSDASVSTPSAAEAGERREVRGGTTNEAVQVVRQGTERGGVHISLIA